jgi:hypothetical protein
MKTTMTALVLGIAIFTVALQGYAEDTSTEKISADKTSTGSIAGSILAIRFKNGKVTELKFRDGKVISDPILHPGEEELANVDLLGLEPLSIELLQLRDRVSGALLPCIKVSCKCIELRIPLPFVLGDFTIYLNPKGEIEKVELPDGTKLSEPVLNLKEKPISNVDLLEHRTFTLIKVRDRAKGEDILRILSK